MNGLVASTILAKSNMATGTGGGSGDTCIQASSNVVMYDLDAVGSRYSLKWASDASLSLYAPYNGADGFTLLTSWRFGLNVGTGQSSHFAYDCGSTTTTMVSGFELCVGSEGNLAVYCSLNSNPLALIGGLTIYTYFRTGYGATLQSDSNGCFFMGREGKEALDYEKYTFGGLQPGTAAPYTYTTLPGYILWCPPPVYTYPRALLSTVAGNTFCVPAYLWPTWYAPNGQWHLVFRTSEFAYYPGSAAGSATNLQTGTKLWSPWTYTGGSGGHLDMMLCIQNDANLVIYPDQSTTQPWYYSGSAVWGFVGSASGLNNAYSLYMDDQGCLFIAITSSTARYSNAQYTVYKPTGGSCQDDAWSSTLDGAYAGTAYYWAGNGDASGTQPNTGTKNGLACVIGGATSSVITPDGTTMYVTSWWQNVIVKISMTTLDCEVVVGTKGTYTSGTYAEGVGTSAGLVNPSGLAISPDGNTLYFADYDYAVTILGAYKGSNNARVRKVDLVNGPYTTSVLSGKGTIGTTAGPATSAAFTSPAGMVIDDAGAYLFILEETSGYIRRVKTSTGYADVVGIYSASGTPKGIALQQPSSGGAYLYVADNSMNVIYRLGDAAGTLTSSTLATSYTFTVILPRGTASGSSGTKTYGEQTTSTAGNLYNPFGLVLSTDQNTLYLTEAWSSLAGAWGNRVRAINLDDPSFPSHLVAGSTSGALAATNNAGTTGVVYQTGSSALFRTPLTMSLLMGNLYVCETFGDNVRRVQLQPAEGAAYFIGDGGTTNQLTTTTVTANTGSTCGVVAIHGLAQSPDGKSVYVAAYGPGHYIAKLTFTGGAALLGTYITCQIIAGSTSGATGNTNGVGTTARFNNLRLMVADQSGSNLYVADQGNNLIRKVVLSSNTVSTLAGSGTSARTDGTGTSASFQSPWGLAINAAGTMLYCVDYGATTSYVRQIVISTAVVTTLYTYSGPLFTVAPSTDGLTLFLGGQSRIISITGWTATATTTTIAGTGTAGYRECTTPGTSTNSLINLNVLGLATTSDGRYLYFSENSGHRVRRIDLTTTYYRTEMFAGSYTITSSVSTANAASVPGTGSYNEIRLNGPGPIMFSNYNPYMVFVAEFGATTAANDVRAIYINTRSL